jgi:hypothetical protein
MLSFYYSEIELIPDNLDQYKPLTILQSNTEQKNILHYFKENRLTRENTYSEYYPIHLFTKVLEDLFGKDHFENNKLNKFELIIYKLDRNYYDSIKDKWHSLIDKKHFSKPIDDLFIQEDQILFVHYRITDNKDNKIKCIYGIEL